MRYVFAWLVLSAAVGCAVDPGESLVGRSSAPIINGVRETGARWVVAVIQRDWSTGTGGLCSGSVIGPYAVMTAKHCVFDGSTRLSPSELLVVVGDDVTTAGGAESFHGVVDIRTTPGTNIDLDIENGNDIAILLLDGDIGVPEATPSRSAPRTGRATTIIGFGRTRTGSPSPTDSGVKYRGQTEVDRVGSRVFETVGAAWTCQGDSGGPALDNASNEVIGITSFGVDSRCVFTNSFYTRVDVHASLIASALTFVPECDPMPEVCDGVDNDCNGMRDEGCTGLGEPCTSDDECAMGGCDDIGGARVCVRDCDPREAIPRCPVGFYCETTGCGTGRCIGGAPGGAPDGTECTADAECASLSCEDVIGVTRCGRTCSFDGDPCPAGDVCEVAEGGTCGSCIPAALSVRPRPFGSPCERDDQCADGMCLEGYCTRPCSASAPCAAGFHCREGLCRHGELGGPGDSCVTVEDCGELAPDCVDADGELLCAAPCPDGTCPMALECSPTPAGDHCLIPGLPLGSECAANYDCRTGLCASTCTRVCDAAAPCPMGFECRPAGDVSGCFPMTAPPPRDSGGCSVGTPPPARGWAGAIAVAMLACGAAAWRRRRR